MSLSRRAVLATAGLVAAPRLGQAQGSWPDQPVRMVLPYAPGGPTDVIARLICDTLSQRLPQRVVVENRTGAGGNIGASFVAKSRPDGATFLFSNTGHAVNRALYAHLDYDPAKDLIPVTIVAESPMVLLVPNSSPARTLADFVAAVRAKPGETSYVTTGTGGALQLVTLLLAKAAGLEMVEVPYRGSAPAAQDLIAGRVGMLYDAGATAFPLATSGQARALVVSSAQRSTVMPDVPTVSEAGYPTATFSVWQGVLAPAGTPAAIVQKMRDEIAAVLAEPALRRRFTELGAERIVANTPAEARAYVDAEMTRWEGVLREAGIQPQ